MESIDFLNVGYGDSAVIQVNDQFCLVDCGNTEELVNLSKKPRITAKQFLQKRDAKQIDLLWLTHLHLDHVGGLLDIAANYSVKKFVTGYLPDLSILNSDVPPMHSTISGVNCLIESLKIYVKSLLFMMKQGTDFIVINPWNNNISEKLSNIQFSSYFVDSKEKFSFMNKCFTDALHGNFNEEDVNTLDLLINDLSIGVRIENQNEQVEIPGDLGLEHCKDLIQKKCSILKVPHHGHKKSIDGEFLQQILPSDIVFSVSNDRTDSCPDYEVINTAQRIGNVHFTDAVEWENRRNEHSSVSFPL